MFCFVGNADCNYTDNDITITTQTCDTISPLPEGQYCPGSRFQNIDRKVCQCHKDSDCHTGYCYKNSCACVSDTQCGPGRQCSWFGRSATEILPGGSIEKSIALGLTPRFTDAHSYGQCQCDTTKPFEGCNGNGKCVKKSYLQYGVVNDPTNTQLNTNSEGYPFHIPDGNYMPSGLGTCVCNKGFKGKFCEIDTIAQDICSNKGEPLCNEANKLGQPVTSQTTGSVITNVNGQNLYLCNQEVC